MIIYCYDIAQFLDTIEAGAPGADVHRITRDVQHHADWGLLT